MRKTSSSERLKFCQNFCIWMPFNLGAFIFIVGGGNWIGTPCASSSGRHSSGTDSCITGEFLYRSTCAVNPCCGLHQATPQMLSPAASELLTAKPSKCRLKRSASEDETKLMRAYPKCLCLLKSTGKYTKLYLPKKPWASRSWRTAARVLVSGRPLNMTVVLVSLGSLSAPPALTLAELGTSGIDGNCGAPSPAKLPNVSLISELYAIGVHQPC